MFTKSSAHTTATLIKAEIINITEREVYEYGFRMVFTYSFNLITALAIGITMGQLWECLVLTLVFIPLRSYAGGYHASSEGKCYVLSAGMMVLNLFLLRCFPVWFHTGAGISLLLAAAAVIILLAPVEHKNKPLDPEEIRVYGRRTYVVLILELAMGAFCCIFAITGVFWVIVLGILSTALSLVAGVCSNKLNL